VVLLPAIASLATAWYISGEIDNGALRPPLSGEGVVYRDAIVSAVDDSTVTLDLHDNASRTARPGTWGARWRGGYGRLGAILGVRGNEIRREFSLIRGRLAPGTSIGADAFAYSGTPRTCLGLPYREVRLSTELGAFPAWVVPGSKTTWVLFVHGKGATREEALRAMEIAAPMGFPCMAITYENDLDAVKSVDGRYHYGQSEWKELDEAAAYALGHGASDLILAGYSAGGAIAIHFMARSDRAASVRGLILEAPCLRLGSALDYGLSRFKLPVVGAPPPHFIRSLAKRIAEFRYGLRWSEFDAFRDARAISVPVLLLHGEEDPVIPIGSSDEWARSRADIRYARFPRAGHVECWNVDPTRYRALLEGFLTSLTRDQPLRPRRRRSFG